ncbi:MAG: hypothetical protein ACO29Q_10410 [Crocinitomicaceae bacterium]
MNHILELTDDEVKMLFAFVAGTYEKSGLNAPIKIRKELYKKIQAVLMTKFGGLSRDKIEFYSNTEPDGEDISFVIGVQGFEAEESEQFIKSLLHNKRWEHVAEDTYHFNRSFSIENFELAKKELIALGFTYKGADGIDTLA